MPGGNYIVEREKPLKGLRFVRDFFVFFGVVSQNYAGKNPITSPIAPRHFGPLQVLHSFVQNANNKKAHQPRPRISPILHSFVQNANNKKAQPAMRRGKSQPPIKPGTRSDIDDTDFAKALKTPVLTPDDNI